MTKNKKQVFRPQAIQTSCTNQNNAQTALPVALLSFDSAEQAVITWVVASWRAAERLRNQLLSAEITLHSLEDAEQALKKLSVHMVSPAQTPDIKAAEAIHFYNGTFNKNISRHGHWIEAVTNLNSVHLELIETRAPYPFTICFFYGST